MFWGAQRKKWLLYTGGIEEKSILLNNNVPKKEHTPMRLLIRIKKVGSKGILHFCFWQAPAQKKITKVWDFKTWITRNIEYERN